MSIFKRGNVFWYEFVFRGRRIRESTRLSNKHAAMRAEAIRKGDLAKGTSGIETVKCPPFGFFVKEEFLPWAKSTRKHNTFKRYNVSAKTLLKHFNVHIDQLSPASVERFKVKRVGECSPAGVNRDLAALRFMMNFAIRQGYIRKNPVQDVGFLREGPGNMRIISHEEEERYLAAADPALRDVAILMLQTGMRPNEVFNIRSENVHLAARFIFIPHGKTSFARRTVPLTNEAMKVLQRRMKKGYLFPHRDDPNRTRTACRTHKTVVNKLKMSFRLYDLRHTFGSRAAMAGVDLPTLKELMGHSVISMTMRYVHPTPAHKVEAMEKLQRFNHSPQESPQDTITSP